MRTYFFGFFVAAMAIIMLFSGPASAFSWEGTAAIASGGDLPGGGYSIATNSFPVNSVVDIKNLENDKVVRVNVISGLNSAGLMATLSRNAANSIGVYGDSSCRILMTEVPHEIALTARMALGPIVTTNTDSTALTDASTVADASEEATPDTIAAISESDATSETDTIAIVQPEADATPEVTSPEADTIATVQPETDTIADAQPETDTIAAVQPEAAETANQAPAPVQKSAAIISLAPSTERIPTPANRPIPREYLAPPIRTYVPPASFSPFQAPLINSLEQGKSYVQIAAYSRPDNVEDEITRAGKEYPVVIQNIGTDAKPLFRVLLGPLNRSESVAALQRAKNQGYKDAFVWHK